MRKTLPIQRLPKKKCKLFPLLILFVVTDVFFFLISFYTLHKIWRKVNGKKKDMKENSLLQ